MAPLILPIRPEPRTGSRMLTEKSSCRRCRGKLRSSARSAYAVRSAWGLRHARALRDVHAVRSAQQGSLIRLAGRHFGDDLAAEQNDGAVADQADLRKLGGEQQHGRPGVGHLAQQAIDLMLRADIDAGSWIEAKQGVEPGGNPSCDHHFLLVAAAQPAQFRASAGVDLQPLDGGSDAPALARPANEAPIRWVADKRQGDVLADRALWQEGQKPVRGDQHKARRDRVAWVVQLQIAALGQDLSPVGAAHPRNAVEQLLLPLALKRRNAKNLSCPHAEGHILEHMAVAEVANLKRRRSLGHAPIQSPRPGLGGADFHRVHAEHQRDDPVFAAGGHVRDADGCAVAQYRRAIAERGDLGDAMRNEDHRIAAFAPAPHDREDVVRQVCRESGGDLVEHQHDRIGRQRAGEIDEAQNRIGNVPHQLAKLEVCYSEIVEMAPHLCEGDIGQSHVLADREIGNERRILVDRNDARSPGFGGGAKRSRGAVDRYGSAIRLEDARENLDERALARAVGAHQRMDLAARYAQRRRSERNDRAESLRQIADLEQRRGIVHWGGPKVCSRHVNDHAPHSIGECDETIETGSIE